MMADGDKISLCQHEGPGSKLYRYCRHQWISALVLSDVGFWLFLSPLSRFTLYYVYYIFPTERRIGYYLFPPNFFPRILVSRGICGTGERCGTRDIFHRIPWYWSLLPKKESHNVTRRYRDNRQPSPTSTSQPHHNRIPLMGYQSASRSYQLV